MNAINTELTRRINNKPVNPQIQSLTTGNKSTTHDSSDIKPVGQFRFKLSSPDDSIGDDANFEQSLLSEMLYFDRF